MKTFRSYVLGFIGVLVFSLCNLCQADTINIAVASNFVDTAKALKSQFEKQSRHHVQLIAGATGKLYAQIRHGAPYDIFLSADRRTAERLSSQNLAVGESRFTYAKGELVFWSPKSFMPLNCDELNITENATLAIANPKLAPYGQAALEVLKNGTYRPLAHSRRVLGESIAQTYQFVHSGNAEFGFVAYSQILAKDIPSSQYCLVSEQLHSPLHQDAVVLKSSQSKQAAKEFVAFLKTEAAKNTIRSHGYSVD